MHNVKREHKGHNDVLWGIGELALFTCPCWSTSQGIAPLNPCKDQVLPSGWSFFKTERWTIETVYNLGLSQSSLRGHQAPVITKPSRWCQLKGPWWLREGGWIRQLKNYLANQNLLIKIYARFYLDMCTMVLLSVVVDNTKESCNWGWSKHIQLT
jgi:hypothetical protein